MPFVPNSKPKPKPRPAKPSPRKNKKKKTVQPVQPEIDGEIQFLREKNLALRESLEVVRTELDNERNLNSELSEHIAEIETERCSLEKELEISDLGEPKGQGPDIGSVEGLIDQKLEAFMGNIRTILAGAIVTDLKNLVANVTHYLRKPTDKYPRPGQINAVKTLLAKIESIPTLF